MLFDKFVTVEWRVASGVNYVYEPHPGFPTAVPMNIQPFSPSFTNMNQGMFFKTYKAFTTASGVVENFRLTVSGTSDKYIVRGRQDYNYLGAQHFELIVERDDR